MIRGDAALPFKDIVRHFDSFTQSILESLVQFNRKFNPRQTPEGDYNVIARGATSLVAKEIRGIQMDQLAQTLQPEEKLHVDDRKWVKARFAARDLTDMLVSEEVADRRKTAQDQQAAQAAQQQAAQMEATIRQTLADAFKNIAQGQKNAANADATAIETALDLLERGMQNVLAQQAGTAGPDQTALSGQANGGATGDEEAPGAPSGGDQGGPGGMPSGSVPAAPGGGAGLPGPAGGLGA